PVRALAPHELALDERDAQTALGQRTRAVLSGRAAAEHDHVVVAAHEGSFSPDCSLTMYSAYQSGQFSSRCPVRFSCSPCAADARRSAIASSDVEANAAPASTRPGRRAVISWNSQPLPSGSLNEANET